jgi:hypothetical protein
MNTLPLDIFAEEDVQHQGFVVDFTLVGNVDRVMDNAPVNPDPCCFFDIDRAIEEKAAEMSLGLEHKGIVGNGKLQKVAVVCVSFEDKVPGAQPVINGTSRVAGKIEDEIPLALCRITGEY